MTAPTTAPAALDFRRIWDAAIPWARYLQPAMKHYGLWEGVYRRVRPDEQAIARARALGPVRLLTIAEDWCGDAANTVPALAALADALSDWELRVLPRDQHPDVMSRYLTNGTRSIPIAIGLDPAFRELGHWGPRPAPLQAWVLANRPVMPRAELYAETRGWYARDAGRTTLRELVAALSSGSSAGAAAAARPVVTGDRRDGAVE